MPTKPYLTLSDVDRIVAAARAEATSAGAAVTICVVDDGGALLRLDRLDGALLVSLRVAEGKARTAVEMRMPTSAIEDMAIAFPPLISIPAIAPFRGGIPLTLDGALVGGVGVSGGSPEQDERIANVAVGALG